jgi:hypothetical protein
MRLIVIYLEAAGHHKDLEGSLFRPVKNNLTKTLAKSLHPAPVYRDIVKRNAHEMDLIDPFLVSVCIRCGPRRRAMP